MVAIGLLPFRPAERESVLGDGAHGILHRKAKVVFSPYSVGSKLSFPKISGACVKACLIRGFVLPKIGFYEDFRLLRQKLLDVTQHISMLLPENFRHLQAGDGGNREGPAKKAPCGWPGHAHRAENEAEGMEGQSSCWAASMAAVWGVFVGTFYKLAYPAAHALAASTGLRKSGRPRSV